MIHNIQQWDNHIITWLQSLHQAEWLNTLMIWFTTLGNIGVVWIVIACYLLWKKQSRHIGMMMIYGLLLVTLLGEGIIKPIIERPRPYVSLTGIQLLINESSTYSFPSGHTASSFAMAIILSYFYREKAWIWWSLASLIAFSRMYLAMHYPTDIVGGIILGVLSGAIVIYCSKYVIKT